MPCNPNATLSHHDCLYFSRSFHLVHTYLSKLTATLLYGPRGALHGNCQGQGGADIILRDVLRLAKISGGENLGGQVVDYPEGSIHVLASLQYNQLQPRVSARDRAMHSSAHKVYDCVPSMFNHQEIISP
jgi:hypothetical protein